MIRVVNLSNYILKRVTAIFPHGKLTVVLGPNGAGKTTLLKVIAGLVKYEGNVFFNDVCVDNVPPFMRGISYVPQNNALFLNMNVKENIAFGLKIRGYDRKYIERHVNELLKMLNLEHVANKYPKMLSGGEAKKVALARALAIKPKALLLDEPYEGLDVEYKQVIEQEITRIVKSLKITTVLVTHDIVKAFVNAEQLIILWNGKLLYQGTPSNMDEKGVPHNLKFWLGTLVELEGNLINDPYEGYVRFSNTLIPLIRTKHSTQRLSKRKVRILIPASAIRLCKLGNVRGVVKEVIPRGNYYNLIVDVDGFNVPVKTSIKLTKGDIVKLRINEAILLN